MLRMLSTPAHFHDMEMFKQGCYSPDSSHGPFSHKC